MYLHLNTTRVQENVKITKEYCDWEGMDFNNDDENPEWLIYWTTNRRNDPRKTIFRGIKGRNVSQINENFEFPKEKNING